MLEFDPAKLGVPFTYKLMIDAIVPRPIALVSTQNDDGVVNLAPFSYFNAVGTHPASLSIAIARKRDGTRKDTLINIQQNRHFVVNSFNQWFVDKAHQAAADYPYGVDEMSVVGLTPAPSVRVKPPRVTEAAVQMECELYNSMEVGDGGAGSTTLIVGKILLIHVREDLFKGGRIDPVAYQPLARLGGDSYARIGDIFDLPRPKV